MQPDNSEIYPPTVNGGAPIAYSRDDSAPKLAMGQNGEGVRYINFAGPRAEYECLRKALGEPAHIRSITKARARVAWELPHAA